MDRFHGVRIGCVIECENGRVVVPDYSQAIVYDAEGTEVERFQGSKDHARNFIDAVRSRRQEDLNADIQEGHLSSALCHAGNISYLLGERADRAAVDRAMSTRVSDDGFTRLCNHLEKNAVDLDTEGVTLGPWLELDTESETFPGNDAANRLVTRDYRAPFIVPSEV